MFTKYTAELVESMSAHRDDFSTECLFIAFQLMLMSLIMYLIVSKIPKLVQGLLAGNPSMGGSDMTGMAVGVAAGAASTVGTVAGAKAMAGKAAAEGKTGWRMSTMGQLGAAMLAKAPITGSAYSAYTGVTGARYNDRQNTPSEGNANIPPAVSPSPNTPNNSGQNNKASTVSAADPSVPSPVSSPTNAFAQQTGNHASPGSISTSAKGNQESQPSASDSTPSQQTDNQSTSVSPPVPSSTSSPSVQYSQAMQNSHNLRPENKGDSPQNTWRRRSSNPMPPKESPKS